MATKKKPPKVVAPGLVPAGGPPKSSTATLSTRALNRALLARQMLLTREQRSAVDVIERLVGLQAQQARPPFIGLWSRVQDFSRDELAQRIAGAEIVKATAMRITLHLMSARDYGALYPALSPMLSHAFLGLGARAKGVDVDAVVKLTTAHLAKNGSATFDELRTMLKAAFPKLDDRAMGYAARTTQPLRFLPSAKGDEARWCFSPDARVESFPIANPTATEEALRALVKRYLAAFGPASVADAQAWSALKNLAPVFASLRERDELVVFRDDKKRELFDLPDAPRPAEDSEAPVRFIADFDNIVLGHADRRRIIADAHRPHLVTKNLLVRATFTVDGFVAGTWSVARKGKTATLTIVPFDDVKIGKAAHRLDEEGQALVRFLEPDAKEHSVEFE
jgi:hypothetical protein